MKTYDLKHNGYTFGQKNGKNKAVEAMVNHLSFQGHTTDKCAWTNNAQGILVIIKDNEYDAYTIEENK